MAAAQPLGVGVLGATGNIGRRYRAELRGIPDQARIVALCARRRERLQRARDEDGAVLITTDWRAVVAHPEVHVVLIATPDDQHLEPALACAAAGRHLICEKPVARTATEAVAIREAFRETGLGHFVPFWSRYEPPLARARELIAGGAVGRARWFTYRRHMPRTAGSAFTWRDDAAVSTAGAVADLGVHMIDVVRWMLGDEPRRVMAQGQVLESSKPYAGELDMQEAAACTKADEERRPTAWDHGTVLVELSGGIAGVLMTSESARCAAACRRSSRSTARRHLSPPTRAADGSSCLKAADRRAWRRWRPTPASTASAATSSRRSGSGRQPRRGRVRSIRDSKTACRRRATSMPA